MLPEIYNTSFPSCAVPSQRYIYQHVGSEFRLATKVHNLQLIAHHTSGIEYILVSGFITEVIKPNPNPKLLTVLKHLSKKTELSHNPKCRSKALDELGFSI